MISLMKFKALPSQKLSFTHEMLRLILPPAIVTTSCDSFIHHAASIKKLDGLFGFRCFSTGEAADVLMELVEIYLLLPNSLCLCLFGTFNILTAGLDPLLKPKTQQI